MSDLKRLYSTTAKLCTASTQSVFNFVVLQKAVNLMSQVPKLCNDMMNLGRLQGYEVGFALLHVCCPG